MNVLRVSIDGNNEQTQYRDLAKPQSIQNLTESQKIKIANQYSGRHITRVMIQREKVFLVAAGGDIIRVTKRSWSDAVERFYDQI